MSSNLAENNFGIVESSSKQRVPIQFRGHLPHFDLGEVAQFVTFRLADSLPKEKLSELKAELKVLPQNKQAGEMRRRIERWLDQGNGHCTLKNPAVAARVEESLLYFDQIRYFMHAWVIMPNHVHILFTVREGHSLSGIIKSWKSYSARQANKILGTTGKFWQADYFDRFIRNDEHFLKVVNYVEENPVRAGLVDNPKDWKFCSAASSLERGRVSAKR